MPPIASPTGDEHAARQTEFAKRSARCRRRATWQAAWLIAPTPRRPKGFGRHRAAVGFDVLAQVHAAQEADLLSEAQDAGGALGPMVPPGQAGAALREAVESAHASARRARSDLYEAVDPDVSLTPVFSPVRQAADGIMQGIDTSSAPLYADTIRLLVKARTLPDVLPFASLIHLSRDLFGFLLEAVHIDPISRTP